MSNPTQPPAHVISFTPEEHQNLLALLDIAVKAIGLGQSGNVAVVAVNLARKISAVKPSEIPTPEA